MIPARFTYLLVDFFCIIFPLLFAVHPRIRFTRQFNYFWPVCLAVAFLFVTWDLLFTSAGIWSFNPKYVLGYYLYNLPVEEILFFICIPYSCVFTYYCCANFIKLKPASNTFFRITTLFATALVIVGLFTLPKLYTSVTFITLGILIFILTFRKSFFLKFFFLSFLIILVPFFISNGILTGAFTNEPVVIYNDRYNLAIRMITIPVEDLFYGMLMLLLNVAGYETYKARVQHKIESGL